jgi:2-keto-4-pentenoate hydratase/2-oxohepta-3-ene-1,7-dioic acid hydratase in catechol pathway
MARAGGNAAARMRLARYRFPDGERLARVAADGETLIDLGTPEPLESLLGTPAMARLLRADGPALPLDPARLLAPLVPRHFLGVGLNYRDHAREQGASCPRCRPCS